MVFVSRAQQAGAGQALSGVAREAKSAITHASKLGLGMAGSLARWTGGANEALGGECSKIYRG
jgi:hypothetical protein